MPKALELSDEALSVPAAVPRAAQRGPVANGGEANKTSAKGDQMPLQVRLPRQEVKAIKVAAAESEQSISDFMLACFHAFMKSGKHAKQ